MKEKEFDNLIRARLKNHESPVPSGMWDRITLKANKRRRGFTPRFYLLTIVFLFVGLAGIFYSSYVRDQPKKDILSNKNNITDTRDKNNLIRSNNKEDHSVHTLNTAKYEDPGGIADVTGKQQAENLVTNTKKRRTKSSSDPEKFKRDNNVDLNNSKKISDSPSDGTSDNVIKKTAKETNATKPDPADNAEMKPSQYDSDKFSVELFTSPAVPVNNISSDNKSYEQALKRASSMQLSYTIGARISYSISKKLSAKIGVQYSQVNEKMNFRDSAGNNFTSTNRYKNIGVPLVLGYKITSTNNLDVFLNTGIILNVASTYKGMIPSESGQPVDIKNENVYNTNASANFYLGINLSKKINNRTDFFAEPWMNYRLKNMVSHYYSFDQKINTLGLSLGLRYRLYKNEPPR
jgi:hypothetical protein